MYRIETEADTEQVDAARGALPALKALIIRFRRELEGRYIHARFSEGGWSIEHTEGTREAIQWLIEAGDVKWGDCTTYIPKLDETVWIQDEQPFHFYDDLSAKAAGAEDWQGPGDDFAAIDE